MTYLLIYLSDISSGILSGQKICQKECQKICQKECQKICQKDISEDMSSERVSKDLSERMAKDTSERMSEDMSERMSENMSGRTLENMSQVYVHTQIWITRIYVCTNGILWMASCFLFYLVYCSKYCWLNFVFVQGSEFGLEAMAEVVVERPETIFIGTGNQVAKGVEHGWRYKLTFVGAERMYVCMEPPSTTHAGDLMFIMEEVVEGNKWYVAYKGRPVPNAEGEQELEKRAAVFRTSASFWEDGVHEWETNNVRSRATYAEPAQAPRPTAFWRGGLMHVVCVCVELQAFCIFGLNYLLAGRSDALRAMTFTGTKLLWILLLLRGAR